MANKNSIAMPIDFDMAALTKVTKVMSVKSSFPIQNLGCIPVFFVTLSPKWLWRIFTNPIFDMERKFLAIVMLGVGTPYVVPFFTGEE
jgi:hypothetical protein